MVLVKYPPLMRSCTQGLILVHFSDQRNHLLWATHLHFSVCREHFRLARLGG